MMYLFFGFLFLALIFGLYTGIQDLVEKFKDASISRKYNREHGAEIELYAKKMKEIIAIERKKQEALGSEIDIEKLSRIVHKEVERLHGNNEEPYSQTISESENINSGYPETKKAKVTIQSELDRAISNKADIIIDYTGYDGSSTTRKLSNIQYNNDFELKGYLNEHIQGYCHLREEKRTFKINRITRIDFCLED